MNNYSLKKSFFVCIIAVFLVLLIQNQLYPNEVITTTTTITQNSKSQHHVTAEQSLDENIEIINSSQDDSSYNTTTVSLEDDEISSSPSTSTNKIIITENKNEEKEEEESESESDSESENKYKNNVTNNESSSESSDSDHNLKINVNEESSSSTTTSTIQLNEEEDEDNTSSSTSSNSDSNSNNNVEMFTPTEYITKQEAEDRKKARMERKERNDNLTRWEIPILMDYSMNECRTEMKSIIKWDIEPTISALIPENIKPRIPYSNESDYLNVDWKKDPEKNKFLLPKPHIFIHMPKAAGSTLLRTFFRNNRGYKFYHSTSHPQYVELRRMVVKDTLFGHFRFGLHKYYEDESRKQSFEPGFTLPNLRGISSSGGSSNVNPNAYPNPDENELESESESINQQELELQQQQEQEEINNVIKLDNENQQNEEGNGNPFGVELNPYSYATMLRDPIDRVLSHYYFLIESETHPLHKETINKTFLEWTSSSPVANNEMCRRIVGIDRNTEEPDDFVQQCIHRIKYTFKYIGIMERFEESLILLSHKFGYTELLFLSQNVGQIKSERHLTTSTLSKDEITLVQRLNVADIKAYRIALEIFENELELIGKEFIQKEAIVLKNEYILNNGPIETKYINSDKQFGNSTKNGKTRGQSTIIYIDDKRAKENRKIILGDEKNQEGGNINSSNEEKDDKDKNY